MILKRIFAKNYEEKNTWNIRHLVDKSFVLEIQQTSILYCRLLDFSSEGFQYHFKICLLWLLHEK